MEYKITKEQIEELESCADEYRTILLKQFFPDAFKTKLEVGKWYKHPRNSIFYCEEIKNGVMYGYGFFDGIWKRRKNNYSGRCACNEVAAEYLELATIQEVETALIAEAKKRGFKWESYVIPTNMNQEQKIPINSVFAFDSDINKLLYGQRSIFQNGVWAEIIPTMTKEQAEKELNCKII